MLKTRYDHLYLSPHFDDAALSCGGRIVRQTRAGETVLIVTVTGGDAPADIRSETVRAIHQRWAESMGETEVTADMVARRRAEDRAAAAVLGADALHLSFLDCIYRCGPESDDPIYPGPTDMFGDIAAADRETIDALSRALTGLPPAARVYLPLGVGRHVDHQAARLAGEQVFGRAASPLYYEEYPYTAIPGALEQALPRDARDDWEADTVWLTENDLAAKVAAVAAYTSQLSSFFTGNADLIRQLREDAQRVRLAAAEEQGVSAPPGTAGGERVWRRISR